MSAARALLALACACAAVLRAAGAAHLPAPSNCTHLIVGSDDIDKRDYRIEQAYYKYQSGSSFDLPITDYCACAHDDTQTTLKLYRQEVTICPPVMVEPEGFSSLKVRAAKGGREFCITVLQYCKKAPPGAFFKSKRRHLFLF